MIHLGEMVANQTLCPSWAALAWDRGGMITDSTLPEVTAQTFKQRLVSVWDKNAVPFWGVLEIQCQDGGVVGA